MHPADGRCAIKRAVLNIPENSIDHVFPGRMGKGQPLFWYVADIGEELVRNMLNSEKTSAVSEYLTSVDSYKRCFFKLNLRGFQSNSSLLK